MSTFVDVMTPSGYQDIAGYTTFHVPALVAEFQEARSIEDWQSILRALQEKQGSLLILGGGSNLLFTKPFNGLVVRQCMKGISTWKEDDNHVWLKVAAGENWHDLVLYTIKQGWGGLENLSLIPGTVGAAPMQNIGAYGAEVKDVIDWVEAIDIASAKPTFFNNEACEFGYRDSIFKREWKGKCVITHVVFRLNKQPVFRTAYGAIQMQLEQMGIKELSLEAISAAVIAIRSSKLPDPKVVGNAGSFFKNPTISKAQYEQLKKQDPQIPGFSIGEAQVKVPAGYLIERCGWKGYRKGDAGCHQLQALVLVNYKNATGEEIYALSSEIVSSVKQRFNIELEREVNII